MRKGPDTMRLILGAATTLILFGCGIINLTSDLPERYIERDVNPSEVTGTWRVTLDSESQVREWITKHPNWGSAAPWRSITINGDGTCQVDIEVYWLGLSDPLFDDLSTNNMTACSWELVKGSSPDDKEITIMKLEFEYPNNHFMHYSLFIVEENEKLILWTFIGDPDNFLPQDFTKAN